MHVIGEWSGQLAISTTVHTVLEDKIARETVLRHDANRPVYYSMTLASCIGGTSGGSQNGRDLSIFVREKWRGCNEQCG